MSKCKNTGQKCQSEKIQKKCQNEEKCPKLIKHN